MRHFAMTGIVTASWISLIFSGSDMRATPPSRRMSAGTRSSAMTAHAPASSAILACSASTTSMITPPLSISASPLLTRMVPMSAIDSILLREVLRHLGAEAVPCLHEDEVPAFRKDDRRDVPNRVEVCRAEGAGDEVVRTGNDKRRRADVRKVGAQIERREDLVVEQQQGVGHGNFAPERLEVGLSRRVVSRKVERELAESQRAELLVRIEPSRLLVLERGPGVRVPGLLRLGVHAGLHRRAVLLGEAGERAGEDESLDPVGMGGRVGGGDHAAVGMPEKVHPLEPEVRSQLVEIGNVVGGRVRAGVARAVRVLGAAGMEQDQGEVLAEPGQIAEIARREAG